MKLFVSYARVDKPYCIRIIETLHAHDIWYDQRLYAGQDWWKEILRRLDWCEVFVYLLSPDSVASLYCRRELEIARRLKRDIIPVLINRETVLPENMKEWQYVDLCDNLTVENVSQLLNAILLLERQRAPKSPSLTASIDAANSSPAASNGKPAEMISKAVSALESGNYDKAILLLKQAKASGYQSRFVSLDKLLRIAESAVADRTETRESQREYQHIVALFAFQSTRQMACEALADFQKEFGDYDPQGLRRLCQADDAARDSAARKPDDATSPQRAKSPAARNESALTPAAPSPKAIQASSQALAPSRHQQGRAGAAALQAITVKTPVSPELLARAEGSLSVKDVLPMLQWCDVPHGAVTISSIVGADEDFGELTEQVDNFVISKFPVTNAQFAIFTEAEDGYRNPRWWDFSEHARRWFNLKKGAATSRFSGDERPRENVNWYEAMALANWLGNLLGMKVALPTIAQWQRAAKGDDDRYFPWGDEYNEEHCNTLETGLKTTSAVDRYQKGTSPYGAYDMAGNVWEWTLNTAAAAEAGRDFRRAVAGGSFVSPCDRAHTSFRYYLDPRVRYSSIGIRLVGLT